VLNFATHVSFCSILILSGGLIAGRLPKASCNNPGVVSASSIWLFVAVFNFFLFPSHEMYTIAASGGWRLVGLTRREVLNCG